MVNVQGGYSSAFPLDSSGKVVSLTPPPPQKVQEILRPKHRQPQSTIETPTPSAEQLTGTTAQREEQIRTFQQPKTIANQFTAETTQGPGKQVISSIGVPAQRLPGVKVTDVTPIYTGTTDEYFTQDNKLYRRRIETYSGGGKIEVGYGVFGGTDQFIEYKNPLGTTSTVKVSKGETIYYNPAGGYGATPSKNVPAGSFEVNVKGERLFGGETAEQRYQRLYEEAGYFGKVKVRLVSAATPENFFGIPSIVDTITGQKTEKERLKTTLTTSLYQESGQTPKTFAEFTKSSPVFYAGVVAPVSAFAITGGLAVAGTLGGPIIAKYAPSTLTKVTGFISNPSTTSTLLPTAIRGVEYYEVQRETKIVESGGTLGDVIGDITVQGVTLATGVVGAKAGAGYFADPFRVSQPEFKGPMEINKVAVAGRQTPTGNVEKEYAVFGQQEAQFPGSILPPRTRTVYGFLEETQLPAGNVVIKPGSFFRTVETKYDFATGEMKSIGREFKIGSPIPTSVSKISQISKGSDLFKVSPEGLPNIQGSKGVVFIQDIETGRVFSIKSRGASIGLDENTYRYIASSGKKGITVRGTVFDNLGLQPTGEAIEQTTQKPLFTFTKEIDRTMKPFDLSEYEKVPPRPIKPSKVITSESKGGSQLLQQSPESFYYGQGAYEKTEGGLLPGEKLGNKFYRPGSEPSFAAIEKSFSISELEFKPRVGRGFPGQMIAPTYQERIKKEDIITPKDFSINQQSFKPKVTITQINIQTQAQTQIQKQRTEQLLTQSEITRQTTTEITPTINIIPSIRIPPPLPPIIPPYFSFNEPYVYRRTRKRKGVKSIYQASLTSGLLGIKAPRIPRGSFGGENPFRRPLIVGTRRRSRKKRR